VTHRTAAFLIVVALCACGEPPADLVLTHARVYTLAWSEPGLDGAPALDAPYSFSQGWRPDAEAVAVRDGRIVFVGSADDVLAFQDAGTEVLDLQDATVLPGLVDAHTHVVELGASMARVNLVGVESQQEAIERAAARAAELPAGTWVVGSGWDEGAWADRYPDLRTLSERIPDHPVFLRGLHGFAGWANRRALEAAGIGPDTEDPVGGEIRRDARGRPTGLFLNNAVRLMDAAVPEPGPRELEEQILAGLNEMARSGYVAVHEAGTDARSLAALQTLEERGALPVRVYAMLSARDTALLARWEASGPDTDVESMLRTRSVKAYYDGALGSRGARMLEDYSDMPGHRGLSGDAYGFDSSWVRRMMRAGFQMGIHAIGDAGNRETLDLLEAVFQETPALRRNRHRVEHAQVVHPDDFRRFAELELIASMEPAHAVEDMPWAEDRVGPARIRGAYAWRTMRETGAPLVFSSDLPGSDWNVFYGMHAAITRRDRNAEPSGGWYREQALTAEETVRAYASWAAFAAFVEDHTGVIEVGRWADLTVLTVDPFLLGSADPGALLEGSIVATIVNGRVVYRREP
jgi:predicted amidohydrolase YtcJ